MATALAENLSFDFESSRLAGVMSGPQGVGRNAAAAITGTGSAGGLISPLLATLVVFPPNIGESWLFQMPDTPTYLSVAPMTRQAPEASIPRRSKELRFRETRQDLLNSLAGQWVCLEHETIVAHGSNAVKVVEEARRRGVRVSYIFRVSDEPEGSVRMGL